MGLTSRDPRRVSASVYLLGETAAAAAASSVSSSVDAPSGVDFGFDAFASKLAALNADKEALLQRQQQMRRGGDDESDSSSSDFPSKRRATMTVGDNKENVFSAFGRDVTPKDAPSSSTSETKVDALLSKLTSVEDAGDVVKDLRTSEILSVYEHKFKSLSMKENHLQVSYPTATIPRYHLAIERGLGMTTSFSLDHRTFSTPKPWLSLRRTVSSPSIDVARPSQKWRWRGFALSFINRKKKRKSHEICSTRLESRPNACKVAMTFYSYLGNFIPSWTIIQPEWLSSLSRTL